MPYALTQAEWDELEALAPMGASLAALYSCPICGRERSWCRPAPGHAYAQSCDATRGVMVEQHQHMQSELARARRVFGGQK